MKKTLSFFFVTLLLAGFLPSGCSSKKDSTIDLEEQERTRQHKQEFEKDMES